MTEHIWSIEVCRVFASKTGRAFAFAIVRPVVFCLLRPHNQSLAQNRHEKIFVLHIGKICLFEIQGMKRGVMKKKSFE
ncbi:MAG: hypothetical protein IJW33_02865 [Lentisphaeria bacterium]|nr:hypothetical protein [Lentisphaeria bacterium]